MGFLTGYKGLLSSITVNAGILVFFLGLVGIDVDKSVIDTVVTNVDNILTSVAGLVAIWGRVRATKSIAGLI